MPPAPPSANAPSQPVFEVLAHSRARLERRVELGDALNLCQWSNSHGHTSYARPGHHTLSVYLEGGHDTLLIDRPGHATSGGAPGRHCVLPAEHESHWRLEGSLRFVHLYLSDIAWADRVVRLLDAEPRAVTLEQRIFAQDPTLSAWGRAVAALDWDDPVARLRAHQLSHAALDHLVLQAARPGARAVALRPRGGLASSTRRRVLEHVEANLDDAALGLGALAAVANLSEFHFARMFRASLGCSVHEWITQRRLARAQALLALGRLPLADVAAACGYAGASHLSERFRARLGATPGQYRAAAQSRA